MDEADVEHAGAKELISQLQSMNPDDSHYDAKVIVLREYIEHHVNEEETKMFPKLVKSGIDGAEMAEEVIHFKEDHKDSESKKKSSNEDGKKKSLSKSTSARSSSNKEDEDKVIKKHSSSTSHNTSTTKS